MARLTNVTEDNLLKVLEKITTNKQNAVDIVITLDKANTDYLHFILFLREQPIYCALVG